MVTCIVIIFNFANVTAIEKLMNIARNVYSSVESMCCFLYFLFYNDSFNINIQSKNVMVLHVGMVSLINKHYSPLTGCLLTGHGFSCDKRHVKEIKKAWLAEINFNPWCFT